MMLWNTIGSYIERVIQVATCNSIDIIPPVEALKNSLLLVVLDVQFENDTYLKQFLSLLVESAPLGIVLYGQGAKTAFSSLIDLLSESNPPQHIMTHILNERTVEDALKDFLRATWPSEDRFEEWKKYSALVIGESQMQKIISAINSL